MRAVLLPPPQHVANMEWLLDIREASDRRRTVRIQRVETTGRLQERHVTVLD
jgi:hypothetical protein